jgi:hypothetical protein
MGSFALLDHLAQGMEALLVLLEAVMIRPRPAGRAQGDQQSDHDQHDEND